jgi:hypothetical protein
MVTHIQVSSAVDGALVGHLNDPRCAGTLLGIKKPRLLEEEKKKFLEKVLGLTFVPEDAARNGEDNARMSSKKDGQGFLISLSDTVQQQVVRWFPEPGGDGEISPCFRHFGYANGLCFRAGYALT